MVIAMRHFLMILLSVFSVFISNVKTDNQTIFARSYVVMEQNSGKLLESKDCNLQRSVASVSKIMTAIIALESDKLFNAVVVDDEIDTIVGSSLYLEKGTEINVIELVYGLLLRSGNDAAVIIAKNVGGTIENFVMMMNQKAYDIGMKNTVFSNPSGLDMFDDGNLSTSYDLALLMRYCMTNEMFREISGTKQFKSTIKGTWSNKHKLIQNYEYAIGGKTGYTKKARRTLITSAKKDEFELIVVTLDCGADFNFHKQKFEHYFSLYTYIPFLHKGENRVSNYLIDSNDEYGVVVDNLKINGGVKVYKINTSKKEVMMYLKLYNDEVVNLGVIKVNSLKEM